MTSKTRDQTELLPLGHSGSPPPPGNSRPRKPLIQAVKEGNAEGNIDEWITYLKSISHEERAEIIHQFEGGSNAVHLATIKNDSRTLEKLVDVGGDPDRCTEDEAENPPLVLAAYYVPLDVFEEAGEEAYRRGGPDENVEDIVIEAGDRNNNSFLALLHCSKDVNRQNISGTTALHVACKRGSTGLVKKLLHFKKKSIGVNKTDNHNNTPLHIACAHGNREMCKVLIDAGADFKEKNNDEMSPLHVAALEHNRHVVEMFFSHDKFVAHKNDLLTDKDKDGHTPFLLAVKSGDDMVVESFIRHGADITVKNNNGANALHLAAKADHTKILEKLRLEMCNRIEDGETMLKWWKDEDDKTMLECKDKDGMTPLLTATASGSVGAVNSFIVKPGDDQPDGNDEQFEANVSAVDSRECNVIHLAVENGDVNVLKAAIDFNTDINMRNNKFQVPLHIACKSGNHEVAMELLKEGAKVTLTDINGRTPLHIATFNGHLKIVKLLISHHADIDAVNEKNGRTPLTYAAQYGHEEIVDYLLEVGANVNGKFEGAQKNPKKISWNTSPLLAASYYGHAKVVERLLKQDGVDVTLEDYELEKGKTPLMCNCLVFAIINGHSEAASAIVKSDHWGKAMRWQDHKPVAVTGQDDNSGNNGDYGYTTGNSTPLKLLIRRMPDVAAEVMDRCVTEEETMDNMYTRKYNYEFIDDMCTQWNTPQSQTNDTSRVERDLHDFAKNHPLQIMVDNERADLLNHHLTTKLLQHKWWTFGLWLYLVRFLIYAVFVAFLTAFALESPTPESRVCVVNYTDEMCEDEYNQPFVLAAAIIIILFSFIRLIIEIIQIYYRYHRYFLEVENWLQLCSFVSSILFVPYGLQSGCQCPESWQWQCGAFAMCVSWLLLVLFLKEFPLTGIYVEMFIHIIFTFMKLFLFALLLVISFGLTFYMIFFRPGERSAFSSPGRSLAKTAVMTTGELDFDGIFFNSQEDAEGGNDLFYPHIAYFLWIVFIIIMPILLSNLLTGLAVDDVNEIQAAAELKILALTVDFTLRFEEIPYFHKRSRKQFGEEIFPAEDDRDLLRNKSYKDPLWNRFIRFILYKNKKNNNDDVSSTGSLDYVQTEIAQLKALINEQNKQQDILLQFIKKTNSKLDLVTKKQEQLSEEFKSCKQSGSRSDSDSDNNDDDDDDEEINE